MLEMAAGIVLPDTGEPWEQLRVGDFSGCADALSNATPEMQQLTEWLLETSWRDRPTISEILAHEKLVSIAETRKNDEGGALKGHAVPCVESQSLSMRRGSRSSFDEL